MLYLNPNKEKILTFEVELSGASSSEINGFVRFFISEDVQLGFPVVVGENQIHAVIGPLKNLVKKTIKNGTVFEAQLDLYTEDQDYFSPWKGEIEIKMPVVIEAKLAEEEGVGSSKFGVKAKVVKEEKTPRPPKKTVGPKNGLTEEEKKWTKNKLKNITHKQIREYIAKNKTKNPAIQDILITEATKAAGTGDKYKVFVEVVRSLKTPNKRR